MEYMNIPQGTTASDHPQESGQGGAGAAMGGAGAAMGGAQPQFGGLYQYQPGVGFVEVHGSAQTVGAPTMQAGHQANMGTQPMGAVDASAKAGMFGQGSPEGTEPKFDQNKLGQMYGVIGDVMNGEADPAKIFGLFANTEGEFWKGALVGAAAVFLLNNNSVKGAVSGAFGSMFGDGPDPKGEQVQVKPSK